MDSLLYIPPSITTSTILESDPKDLSKSQPFTRKHNRNRSNIVTPTAQAKGTDPIIKFFRRTNKLNADIWYLIISNLN